MSKGHESVLGANGAQERPLGTNKAEQSAGDDRERCFNTIETICADYERTIARKAHHCLSEIASLLRGRHKEVTR